MEQDGIWLPIVDYANLKEISISTVRRFIKASKVKYKKNQGRFLIWANSEELKRDNDSLQNLQMEKEVLKNKLKKLKEENNDLRMLVHLYENDKSSVKSSDLSP